MIHIFNGIACAIVGYLATDQYRKMTKLTYSVSITTNSGAALTAFEDACKKLYGISYETISDSHRCLATGFYEHVVLQIRDPEGSLQGAVIKVESRNTLHGIRVLMEHTIDGPDCSVCVGGVNVRVAQ